MRTIPTTLRNLVTDERGNVLMTFGLCSMVAIAAVGGAVDFGRANQTKSKMQNVLDAALVSGVAKYRETADWNAAKATAEAIFKSTFADAVAPTADNPNPTAAVDQAKVTITQSGNTLTGTASMTVTTPFINLVTGRNMSTLVAGSSIPASGKQVELAVMVDLTGSMGWSAASGSTSLPCNAVSNPTSKLDYLKCAGEDLLNILLPASGANNSAVRIGIAPFSDYVNAGPYAAAVTGLPSSGGSIIPSLNLTKTKYTKNWKGSYSGSSAAGSQFGVVSGSTATATTTHCTPGNSTELVPIRTSSGYRIGVEISRDHDYATMSVPGVITMNSSSTGVAFRKIDDIDGTGNSWIDFQDGVDSYGYFVPLPESNTGLTRRTRTATSNGTSRTGNIGAAVDYESDIDSGARANLESWGFMRATSNSNGYWKLTQIDSDGNHDYTWTTSGWYIPLYESLMRPTSECVEAAQPAPASKLISCVTERMNGNDLDYTADAVGVGRYVGPFNHGNTANTNYSDDGKCYVAGRELPAVIPLTNSRTTLESFFQNATAGGATPGHLGTAWASYLLSPNWSDIWPSESAPTAYMSTNIKKFAILMTDGEYNLQFSTGSSGASSAKQALMLCKQMRDNGISVFTVGFGFEENAAPPTTNIEALSTTERTTPLTGAYTSKQKALDTLAKCASSNSSYYFPYDGQALRDTFKSIATAVSANVASGSGRLTD